MPHTSRTIVVRKPATISSDETSSVFNVPEWCTGLLFKCTVGTASGTTPTLNCRIQQGLPNAASGDTVGENPQAAKYGDWQFFDFASGTQITATGQTCVIRIVGGGNSTELATDNTLAAGTIKSGPIGGVLRFKFDIGGTNPAFTSTHATCEFLP